MKSRKSVLIVSRDLGQFSDAAKLFAEAGYSIRLAVSNDDALKAMRDKLPNLMISELAMVDIDGLELCRCARKMPGAEKLAILLLGDLSRKSPIVIDAELCGASAYFQKPVKPKTLVEAGNALVENRTFASTSEKLCFASKVTRSKKKDLRSNDGPAKGYCWLYRSGEKGALIKVYLPEADTDHVGRMSFESTFPNPVSLVGAEDAALSLGKLILGACQIMIVEKGDADKMPAFAE